MKHVRFGFITLALLLCLAALSPAAMAESCYVGCPDCHSNADCASCAFCVAVTATARPRENPTPSPAVRPIQTMKPAATRKPESTATASPTAKPAFTPAPSLGMGDYTTITGAKQEEIVLQLLNQDRLRNGLAPLPVDPALSRIARIKSQDMKDNRYFAHESPTYGRAAQMLTHFGYAYQGVGENIAHHATVEKAEAAFMSSWGHRINILGKQWTKVGIGVVYDDQGFVYVTQLFVR